MKSNGPYSPPCSRKDLLATTYLRKPHDDNDGVSLVIATDTRARSAKIPAIPIRNNLVFSFLFFLFCFEVFFWLFL